MSRTVNCKICFQILMTVFLSLAKYKYLTVLLRCLVVRNIFNCILILLQDLTNDTEFKCPKLKR